MKMIFKRVLSVVLTVVMILTAIPFSANATENETTVEQGNNDVSVSATNSLGAMITETLEDENLGVDSDYVITDLTFEGNTATVSYMALENCNLVVAVYDENTMQMLTSEILILPSDEVSATVTFIDVLPEFFVAKAFLVDLDYAPLCKEYVSRKNTTEFVEFMETKSTDFEEDKVINLDESESNNFLVLSDDAQKIKGDEETNVLVSSDTEINTYVFENIDSSISSLKKGDVFHLDNGDVENLVVIKVASILIDGTTATIVAEASSLEEVFDVIKLDSDELKTGVEVDSAESGMISEDGEIITDAFEGGNKYDPWKETKTFSLEKEFKNYKGDSVKITGTAVFTLEAHYEIYVSRKWSEVSFIINPSAVVTVTVDGVISERRYKIGHFYFSMYGVTIGVEPEFVFSASANITLTGTWKTQVGFGFNTSDGFVNKSISPTFEPTVKIIGQFYIGFNLAPYLTFVDEAVVDIKFTAELGITVKATYLNNSGHECDNCIDGDILWSAKVDMDLAILWGLIDTSENENYEGDIWDKSPTKFADFYYSFDHNEFGWGECPYESSINISGTCGENLTWTFYEPTGKLTINGSGAMDDNYYPWSSYDNKIKSIVIYSGVTTIGDNAFFAYDNLTSVTIGNSVTTIGEYAFFACESLSSVTIGNSVTTIGEHAFYACESLSNVKIGKSVADIKGYAFYACENLTSITLPSSVTNIGEFAFYSTGLTSVTIPSSVTTIGDAAFSWCNSLTCIKVNSNNYCYSGDSNGVLYNKSKSTLIQYPAGNSRTHFIIPGNITAIGNNSFRGCYNLTNVTIPNSVTTIGDHAFAQCTKLINIIIPDRVTTIGISAFETCTSLIEITIGNNITSIGDFAFRHSKIENVYYGGNEAKWNNISIGDSNEKLTSATIHYNSTGPTTDSVFEFIVDSVDETVIESSVALENCFTFGGCLSGGSYTLVTVTENTVPLTLSNENILYFDQVVANDCGMISTDFLPKTQVDGCVTLLIGDFGNGTEARVVTTTTYTAGDINLDTSFDGMDAIVVACVVNGMLTEEQIGTKKFEIADANLDGVIDTLDITYLENKGLYLS